MFQRLKVWCLGVMLRGLKDQLNEFNQGVNPRDTRRMEYVRYKRPTLDERRISFSWVELTSDEKREEHVLGAQCVPVDRYAGNVAEIN